MDALKFDLIVWDIIIKLKGKKTMNAKMKKISAFITVGIVAVGAVVAMTDSSTHRYIDEQLYQHTNKTFFQPVEDYRLELLFDYVEKNSSLHDVYTLNSLSYKQLKQSLKDEKNFDKEMDSLKEYVKTFQKSHDEYVQYAIEEKARIKEARRQAAKEAGEEFDENPVYRGVVNIQEVKEPSISDKETSIHNIKNIKANLEKKSSTNNLLIKPN